MNAPYSSLTSETIKLDCQQPKTAVKERYTHTYCTKSVHYETDRNVYLGIKHGSVTLWLETFHTI